MTGFITLIGYYALLVGAVLSIAGLALSPEFRGNLTSCIVALMAMGLFGMATCFLVELHHMKEVWFSPLVEEVIRRLVKELSQPDLTSEEHAILVKKIKELQAML